ncbi:MAG: glycosyltransferase [Candidatus Eisenbacteria bacterium]|nr:glycosyltransferase [Candidatus Eisenbacteria bacterium]
MNRLAPHFDAPALLPDGIFADHWSPRLPPEEGPLRVGMIGLLAREKGFHELLLPELSRRGWSPVSNWEGPPPDRFPDEQLLPPGFVEPLYQQMDLYAMLSDAEGTPMPLLEAMASGVGAVATRTGAAEELVVPGETGALLDARTPEGLRHALDRLPTSRSELHALGRRARARVLALRPAEASLAALRLWYARALRLDEPLRERLSRRTPRAITLITAHPDDELLWAGGLILAHPWHRWRIVCATGSESDPRGIELQSVAAHLGAELTLLGLPDRADVDLEALLAPQLNPMAVEGDLLLCHGAAGEYGHPHHRAVHRAVSAWHLRNDCPIPLWTFAPAEGESFALPPRVAARKAALLALYRAEGRRFRVLEHAAASSGCERFLPFRSVDTAATAVTP